MSNMGEKGKKWKICRVYKRYSTWNTQHKLVTLMEWLNSAIHEEMVRGDVVYNDVQLFLLPLSRDAKGYMSMYAYNNHIRVCGVEVGLYTCDNGVRHVFAVLSL